MQRMDRPFLWVFEHGEGRVLGHGVDWGVSQAGRFQRERKGKVRTGSKVSRKISAQGHRPGGREFQSSKKKAGLKRCRSRFGRGMRLGRRGGSYHSRGMGKVGDTCPTMGNLMCKGLENPR